MLASLGLVIPMLLLSLVLLGKNWAARGRVLIDGAWSRLQFCENGIWSYTGLNRWQKIESYHFAGCDPDTLDVQVRTRLPIYGRGAIPTSVDIRDDVDAILRRKIVGVQNVP